MDGPPRLDAADRRSARSGARATCSSRSGCATSRRRWSPGRGSRSRRSCWSAIAARARGAAGARPASGRCSRCSARSRSPGPFLLIAAGEQEITSSLAGILVTSAPLFTALLAIWSTRRSARRGCAWSASCSASPASSSCSASTSAARATSSSAGLAVLLAGLGYAVGGLPGQAPARRRAADRRRRLGDGREHRAARCRPRSLSAPADVPGLGPVAAVVALGVVGTGIAFVDLLRADRDRRPGARVHRHLPGAGLRGRLRRDCCSTRRSTSRRSSGSR